MFVLIKLGVSCASEAFFNGLLTLTIALALPVLAIAGGEHVHDVASPNDPPIKITINPEARVSVILAAALPPPARCGTPAALLVKIIDQGFVTSRLEAEVVGDIATAPR